MIKPGEIQQKAREAGVRDQQIEKDYVLSWILNGIAQHNDLSKVIVFKGGTVLKKFYFEDYRYSEDLDFTLNDDNITNEQILEWFACLPAVRCSCTQDKFVMAVIPIHHDTRKGLGQGKAGISGHNFNN